MKVFISWSGDLSHQVALALREWLPDLFHDLQPFVSSKDIEAGVRWQNRIATELEESEFGIVCVTKSNQRSSWVQFEAGALAKTVATSHLVPLAIDLGPAEVDPPLGHFQAKSITSREDVRDVVETINAVNDGVTLESGRMERVFDRWWPDLEDAVAKVLKNFPENAAEPPARSDREMLEELLNYVRSIGAGALPARYPATRSNIPREIRIADIEMLVRDVDLNARVRPSASGGIRISSYKTMPAALKNLIREMAAQDHHEVEFVKLIPKRQASEDKV